MGKLIVFYDDNGISIDGKVVGWFTDDTPKRFAAYGWHVVPDVDGLDAAAVAKALRAARAEHERPSLICCKTIIGFGAPDKQGTEGGARRGAGRRRSRRARKTLGWAYAPFEVPEEIRAAWDHRKAGAQREQAWAELFARYAKAYPGSGRRVRAAHARRPAAELGRHGAPGA